MKTWVKLYTEIIDDPKIARLSWAERGIWSALLALAGKLEARDPEGTESGLVGTAADVAWYLRADAEEITRALTVFEAADMAHRDGEHWYLTHWHNRQARSPSSLPEATRDRQRSHRTATTCHEDVTSVSRDVTRLDKNRIDKNRVEESGSAPQKPKPVTNYNLPHDDLRPRPVKTFSEVTRYNLAPNSEPWVLIAQSIPDNEQALARWKEAVTAWVNCGNSTRNVSGMIDWYKSGKRDNRVNLPTEPSKEDIKRKEEARHAEELRVWKLQHPQEATSEAIRK